MRLSILAPWKYNIGWHGKGIEGRLQNVCYTNYCTHNPDCETFNTKTPSSLVVWVVFSSNQTREEEVLLNYTWLGFFSLLFMYSMKSRKYKLHVKYPKPLSSPVSLPPGNLYYYYSFLLPSPPFSLISINWVSSRLPILKTTKCG